MSSTRTRILVVEDDHILRSAFEKLLPAEGYETDVVADAEEGLQRLGDHAYDVVITDIVLPGIDGIDLCRRVKEEHPDLEVIVMTGFADTESALAALDAGVYDYLVKPFDDFDAIARKIDRAIEKRRFVRENRRLVEDMRAANAKIEAMNQELEAKVAARTEELERANRRLEQLTLTDDVTELYNQRFLQQRIDDEYLRAVRYGHGLAVVMIDLDHFKTINDNHDHLFGTLVLRQVGAMLQEGVRTIDMVVRYGGDEFVVLLPHTELDEAIAVGSRLRELLAAATLGRKGEGCQVTGSFGIAALGECDSTDAESLLRAADKALYFAKSMGRNRVAVMHGRSPVAVAGGV